MDITGVFNYASFEIIPDAARQRRFNPVLFCSILDMLMSEGVGKLFEARCQGGKYGRKAESLHIIGTEQAM